MVWPRAKATDNSLALLHFVCFCPRPFFCGSRLPPSFKDPLRAFSWNIAFRCEAQSSCPQLYTPPINLPAELPKNYGYSVCRKTKKSTNFTCSICTKLTTFPSRRISALLVCSANIVSPEEDTAGIFVKGLCKNTYAQYNARC